VYLLNFLLRMRLAHARILLTHLRTNRSRATFFSSIKKKYYLPFATSELFCACVENTLKQNAPS